MAMLCTRVFRATLLRAAVFDECFARSPRHHVSDVKNFFRLPKINPLLFRNGPEAIVHAISVPFRAFLCANGFCALLIWLARHDIWVIEALTYHKRDQIIFNALQKRRSGLTLDPFGLIFF